MNKKILTITLAAFIAIGVVSLAVSQVSAQWGNTSQVGPNHTEEREEIMDKVLQNNDYDGWVALMTENGRNPGILRKIDTKEKFEVFVQIHELMDEGKIDEANELKAQLGLGMGAGRQARGMHNGSGTCVNQ